MIKNIFYYIIGLIILLWGRILHFFPVYKRSYIAHPKEIVKIWEGHLEKCGVEPDLIVPQKKLERFNDLRAGITELGTRVNKGDVFVALVDLKTRTKWLGKKDPLNIYRYGDIIWNMLKFRGCPYRVHPLEYRNVLEQNGWTDVIIKPIEILDDKSLACTKPCFAKRFKKLDDRELKILSFFLLARKK